MFGKKELCGFQALDVAKERCLPRPELMICHSSLWAALGNEWGFSVVGLDDGQEKWKGDDD